MASPPGTDIYSYPVGSDLPENELTSWDPLGLLIDKYNEKVQKRGFEPIDKTLVEIRDALAHGRVSSDTPDANFRLLKFSKPDNGRVRVEFNELLSLTWFTAQKKRVSDAVLLVHRSLPPASQG